MDRKRTWPVKGLTLSLLVAKLMALWVFIIGCEGDLPAAGKRLEKSESTAVFDGTIVAVGDSLTAGLGVPEEMAYPARLARRLQSAGLNYRVINAGVSGETSSGTRSRIEWVIASLKPDIVILEIGANDGLRGVDPRLLEENLEQICEILIENNIRVILAGMKMLPNLGPAYTREFMNIYPKIAKQYPLIFMPFFLQDVAGDARLNQTDRIHPTAEGYERITDNLYPYVLQAIELHRKKTGE